MSGLLLFGLCSIVKRDFQPDASADVPPLWMEMGVRGKSRPRCGVQPRESAHTLAAVSVRSYVGGSGGRHGRLDIPMIAKQTELTPASLRVSGHRHLRTPRAASISREAASRKFPHLFPAKKGLAACLRLLAPHGRMESLLEAFDGPNAVLTAQLVGAAVLTALALKLYNSFYDAYVAELPHLYFLPTAANRARPRSDPAKFHAAASRQLPLPRTGVLAERAERARLPAARGGAAPARRAARPPAQGH